jgi:acetyl-CoA decarbonylase/synthase complex subunit gamma
MALSALEIYKHLPKTNCKDCGFPTCLAFAMQLAAKKQSLDKCPHVTDEGKAALEGASAPPIKLVTIGTGESKLEIGNETVMYRHEETFHHPCGVAVMLPDSLSAEELARRVKEINSLRFERVGQHIKVDVVAVESTGEPDAFAKAVQTVADATDLNLVLVATDPKAIQAALPAVKERVPLIAAATDENAEAMAELAKDSGCPLVARADGVEALSALTQKLKGLGVENLVLDSGGKSPTAKVDDLTVMRRMALRKRERSIGYPSIAFTTADEPALELAEAAGYVAKYAGVVVTRGLSREQILALLTVRQNIYTDPQKPVMVEPKVYEIGRVTNESPLLVTTNFSITYYTVAGEVEASKVPTYILSVDAEGMSVLTAWAAEKFTPEIIAASLDKSGAKDMVSHRNVVIPGYVAVLSGQLEEESGWKVLVGPREASGIPKYLRELTK